MTELLVIGIVVSVVFVGFMVYLMEKKRRKG